MTRAATSILALLALAGCAEPQNDLSADNGNGVTASGAPPPAASVARPPASPPASAVPAEGEPAVAPPAEAVPEAGSPGGVVAANDPSAPPDTPLCGQAAREEDSDAAAIAPDVMAGGGACTETAGFDPLTDTFIGADGYRHVCQ